MDTHGIYDFFKKNLKKLKKVLQNELNFRKINKNEK